MLRTLIVSATALGLMTGAAVADPKVMTNEQMDAIVAGAMPADPGIDGRAKAFFTAGFQKSMTTTGKSLDHAADLFGDNGVGNGADPDALGLAVDHDPGNFEGAPDITR